jgi:hypothetical protein
MHGALQHAFSFSVDDAQLVKTMLVTFVEPRGHEIRDVTRRKRMQIEHAVHRQLRHRIGIERLVCHGNSLTWPTQAVTRR